jgi:hypothetical protein
MKDTPKGVPFKSYLTLWQVFIKTKYFSLQLKVNTNIFS